MFWDALSYRVVASERLVVEVVPLGFVVIAVLWCFVVPFGCIGEVGRCGASHLLCFPVFCDA